MSPYFLREKLIVDPAGAPFAVVSSANILATDFDPVNELHPHPAANRLVMWSGWMGESMLARDFRAWSKEAWTKFDAWCDSQLPRLVSAGSTICFRPHPRHTLSDAQSCVSFLKKRAGQPFQVLLDPVGMLAASMIPRAEDHFNRILDALVQHAGVAGVIVTNAVPAPDEPDLLTASPIHRGQVTSGLIQLIASRIPAEKPLILLHDEVPAQLAVLNAPASPPR